MNFIVGFLMGATAMYVGILCYVQVKSPYIRKLRALINAVEIDDDDYEIEED